MLRRISTILLIVALPVQGLAVPHTHAGDDPEGHAARPHFHVHGHPHHHHHHDQHHHGHAGHHHHGDFGDDGILHAPGQPSADVPSPGGQPADPSRSDSHDSDAVYGFGPLARDRAGADPAPGASGTPAPGDVAALLPGRDASAPDPTARPPAVARATDFLATVVLRL